MFNIDVRNMDDETDRQLYEILRADNADELCHLVSEGLGANEADADKNTLLHQASRYRAADCMRVLLAAGADVTARNKYGETPLHEAVGWWSFFRENSGKSATRVDILLKAGADASAMADTWIAPRWMLPSKTTTTQRHVCCDWLESSKNHPSCKPCGRRIRKHWALC